MKDHHLDRRNFIKLMGSGVFILFHTGFLTKDKLAAQRRGGREYPEDFNAYLHINTDGRVTCFSGKIEMGQGVITSLAQMLAEELDVALDAVDIIMGDTTLCPYDMGTFGSRSTKYFGPALREAGAEARAVLIQLAAEQLKIPASMLGLLDVKDGVVYNRKNPKQKVSYAELAKGKKITRHIKDRNKITIKHPSQHRVSGIPTKRTDAKEKVTGAAKFAGDFRLPGMLYAKIIRPPVHGATLEKIDTSAAEKIKGVKIVRDGDLVAVLHKLPDVAETARQKVKAQYNIPKATVNNNNIFDHLLQSAPPGQTIVESGNLAKGASVATKKVKGRYFNHYVAHAPIEPHTAVAKIEGNKADIWASTQTPFRAQPAAAQVLGFAKENVRVHPAFVGGGFGGKTGAQQVIEAARLAKLAGCPVQVAWTREEEFFFDTFRPAAVIDIDSGLDDKGHITYWDFHGYFAGSRSSEPIYHIPHYRVLSHGRWRGGPQVHPFGVGAWRGPGSNTNIFAIESHIDTLANAAGMDPLSFRLANLQDKRMERVIEAAAKKFAHHFSSTPGFKTQNNGHGFGIACTNYLGTYVTTMAELKVNKQTGAIRVIRLVCAQDTGEIINPEGIRMQIEGCLTMGISSALSEEIQFNGGEIQDKNFDTYEITRFSWLPKIETVLVDNPGMAPQGCGEPAITTMGAVLANAVYDAIGIRFDILPITPKRVKEAIAKAS